MRSRSLRWTLRPGRGEGARPAGPLSALWYIVFVVPFFLWTPDAPRRPGASNAVATGLRELKHTLAVLPSRRSLVAYLVSSMFYRDALGGMYVFGGIYAAGVLGWGMFEIGLFGALGLLGGVAGVWITFHQVNPDKGYRRSHIGPPPQPDKPAASLGGYCSAVLTTRTPTRPCATSSRNTSPGSSGRA